MSPEKSKNQFAILFQQYQTRQPSEELDNPEAPPKLAKPAKTTTKKKKTSAKTTTTQQKQTTSKQKKKTSKPSPQSPSKTPAQESISAPNTSNATTTEKPALDLLDDDLDPNLLIDTHNLEVIRATRSLPPRRQRKQSRPRNPHLEKLIAEEAQEQSAPRKRGRPANGKRSDPNWVARTFYVRKSTDDKVDRVLQQMKRYNVNFDKSELIDLLLEAWAMVESREIDDFQIGEILQIDPPKYN